MTKLNLSLLLFLMNKIKILLFFLLFILLVDCSFDDKTGFWSGTEKEKVRISQLEKGQKQNKNLVNVYSSAAIYNKEIPLSNTISISNLKKNLSFLPT